MSENVWLAIGGAVLGVIGGACGVLLRSMSSKARELAEAVLVQNVEITNLKVEIAKLEERLKAATEKLK